MNNTNFTAALPANIQIGTDVQFNQHAIFNGQGKVKIGDFVEFGYPYSPHFYGFHILILAELAQSIVEIGDYTSFSNDVSIRSLRKVKIGKHCLIGDRVTIYDSDMHEANPFFRKRSPGNIAEVNIEDNVWLGSGVTILKGVTIGENSIVAAGSVVTKDIPKNSIAMGNPAQIVKKGALSSEKDEMVQDLQNQIKSLIKEFIEKDQLNQAKAVMKQYSYLLNDDMEMYSIKSIIFIKENNFNRAEELLKEGLMRKGNDLDILYNLAYVYELKAEKELAISFYLKAIEYCEEEELQNEIEKQVKTLEMSLQ